MQEMSDNTKAILSALLGGPLTAHELREALPQVPVKAALPNLQTHKLIAGERVDGASVVLYGLTRNGRLLVQPSGKGSGVVGTPRQPHSGATYTGPAPIVTRPGAMDAYRKPSRRGDVLVPHAPPISIASHVQSTKFP